MDSALLRELEALPIPKAAQVTKAAAIAKKRLVNQRAPVQTTAQERFEQYAGDLSEEVRRLQAELQLALPQAKKFEEVRSLVKSQAKILGENDRLENRILRVLGLPMNAEK